MMSKTCKIAINRVLKTFKMSFQTKVEIIAQMSSNFWSNLTKKQKKQPDQLRSHLYIPHKLLLKPTLESKSRKK